MANIEQLQEKISEIGKNFNEKDYEDFSYYIEAQGFKLMNSALWSIMLCLLSLIVINLISFIPRFLLGWIACSRVQYKPILFSFDLM